MRSRIRGALVLCTVMALAACSTGGNGASPGPSPSTMSDAEILAIGRQAAECIRANGVPDFPDPVVNRGRLQLPEESRQILESKYSDQQMDQAQQACKSIMDRLPVSVLKGEGGGDDNDKEPGPGDVEALKKLAQCVREHGIPEWPDPKPDGSFPLTGTPLEGEGKSKRIGDAFKECESLWGGRIAIS